MLASLPANSYLLVRCCSGALSRTFVRRKNELNGQPSSRSRRFAVPREGRSRCRPTIEWFALRPQAYAPGPSDGGALSLRAKLAPGATQTARDCPASRASLRSRPRKEGVRSRRITARRPRRYEGNQRERATLALCVSHWKNFSNAELRHQSPACSSAQPSAPRSTPGNAGRQTSCCQPNVPRLSSIITNNDARPRPAPCRP